jgi:hypothetical protein
MKSCIEDSRVFKKRSLESERTGKSVATVG